MKPTRLTLFASTLCATIFFGPIAVTAETDPRINDTQQEILQLLQADESNGIEMVSDGQAHVNVRTGQIRFEANRLPILAGPSDMTFGMETAPIMVRGTLVCRVSAGSGATLVDTPAVPVTGKGEATYAGYVQLPDECLSAAYDIAFFIRTTGNGR